MNEFRQEWFAHPRWWFSASKEDDAYLATTYGHLLVKSEAMPEPASIETLTEGITWILIFDQLPHHVARAFPHLHMDPKSYLPRALAIAKRTLSLPTCALETDLSIPEWCFLLLPLRHTYDPREILPVMFRLWRLVPHAKDVSDISLLRRYIKATYERCPLDQSPWVQTCRHDASAQVPIQEFEGILANCPNSDIPSGLAFDGLKLQVVEQLATCQARHVILSLSGGVDSMTLSAILKEMMDTGRLESVHAVHINYTNRRTAYEEEAFVREWAAKLGFTCHVRRITEIKREPAMKFEMRDLYESYTRNVRYNTYKYVWESLMKQTDQPMVMMGHNRDDCFENILTNIIYQSKYNDLQGMDIITTQDNIRFVRPMLGIAKQDIYSFAQKYHIPHLPNSTPSWHSRGKIREVVRPTLLSWHHNAVDSFFSLAQWMKELHQLMELNVQSMVAKTIKTKEDTTGNIPYIEHQVTFMSAKEIPTLPLFWRSYILALANKMISMKSLRNFQIRLEKSIPSSNFHGKTQLASNIQVEFQTRRPDGQVIARIMVMAL